MDNKIKESDLRDAAEKLQEYGIKIVRREPVSKQEEHEEDYR
jgi:GTP cyclohydrolase II